MPMNQFGAGFTIGATDAATPVINKVNTAVDRMAQNSVRRSNMLRESWRGVQLGLTALGERMMRAGGAISGYFDDAMQRMSEFHLAMARVGSIVEYGAVSMKDLEESTQAAAIQFGTPVVEQSAALYGILASGITDAARAQETLTAANRLALGGATDVNTAVGALTTMVNSFADSGVTATEVADSLFTAIRIGGRTNVQELASGLGKIAETASAVGVSSDELLASITAMTQKGTKTRFAISGVAAVLQALRDPSDSATKEAKRLGIGWDTAAIRAKGFGAWVSDVVKKVGHSEAAMSKLFGSSRTFGTIAALAAEGGKTFAAALDAMRNKAGSAERATATMMETFQKQEGVLGGLKDAFRMTFTESLERILLPGLKLLNRALFSLLNTWKQMPEGARDAIVGLVFGLGKLAGVAGAIMLAVGALGLFGVSLTGIVTGAAAFLIVGPLIIGLIAAFGTSIFAAFAGIRDQLGTGGKLEDVIKRIGLAARGAAEIFSSGQLSKAVRDELDQAGNEGPRRFVEGFERFKKRFDEFWAGLKEGFLSGVRELDFGPLQRKLEDFLGAFSTGGENMESVRAGGRQAGRALAEFGQTGINTMTRLADALDKVLTGFDRLNSKEFAKSLDTMRAAFEGFVTVIDLVRSYIGGIGLFIDSIKLLAEGIWSLVLRIVRIIQGIGDAVSFILTFGKSGSWAGIKSLFEKGFFGEAGAPRAPAPPPPPSAETVARLRKEQADIGSYIGRRTATASGLPAWGELSPERQKYWMQRYAELGKIVGDAVRTGAKEGMSGMGVEVDGYRFGKVVDKARSDRAPLQYAEVGALAGVGMD